MSIAQQVTEPMLTCGAVLAETAFHLENSALVLAMVTEGFVKIAFAVHENVAQLASLAKRYVDRKPDFADLCLVRLSELHPKHSLITIDRADFTVYRRNKREIIPVIFPPE
jgi:predicted nucleic acid-binding protein